MQKTLMFFEGLPYSHLGATVLLRGGTKTELTRLKQACKTVLFASYNWRLEKSFLMDEFAQPPDPKTDEFFDDSSKESSPDFHLNRDIKDKDNLITTMFQQKNKNQNASIDIKEKGKKKSLLYVLLYVYNCILEKKTNEEENNTSNKTNEEKKLLTKSVEDYSDPLHSYLTHDDVLDDKNNSFQQLSVAELPFSNKFRKAIDETILSTSPYLQFFIPYLETDMGRKCKLREFFPNDIYYSKQFLPQSENNGIRNGRDNIVDSHMEMLNKQVIYDYRNS